MLPLETEHHFPKLCVERPYGEPGVYIGDEYTALVARLDPASEDRASVLAAAPLLLEACIQARAALPDIPFAEKCGVKRTVIDQLNNVLGSIPAERGTNPLGVYVDGQLVATVYAGQERYIPIFSDAFHLLSAATCAKGELPGAWRALKLPSPDDVLALIDSAIAAALRKPVAVPA